MGSLGCGLFFFNLKAGAWQIWAEMEGIWASTPVFIP